MVPATDVGSIAGWFCGFVTEMDYFCNFASALSTSLVGWTTKFYWALSYLVPSCLRSSVVAAVLLSLTTIVWVAVFVRPKRPPTHSYPFILWLAPKGWNWIIPLRFRRRRVCRKPNHGFLRVRRASKPLPSTDHPYDAQRNSIFVEVPGEYDLFLHPEPLMPWFILFSALPACIVIPVNSGIALAVFIVFWVGYALIYYFWPHPALPGMLQTTPPESQSWLFAQVERIDLCFKDRARLQGSCCPTDLRICSAMRRQIPADVKARDRFVRMLARLFLPFMSKPWRLIRRTQRIKCDAARTKAPELRRRLRTRPNRRVVSAIVKGSPREWVLRSAIMTMFAYDKERWNAGAARFMFYWCAPMWMSYALLYLPLYALAFLDPGEGRTIAVLALITALLTWAGLCFLFYAEYLRDAGDKSASTVSPIKQWTLDYKDIDHLPAFFLDHVSNGAKRPLLISTPEFPKIASLVQVAAFTVYGLLLSVAANLTSN